MRTGVLHLHAGRSGEAARAGTWGGAPDFIDWHAVRLADRSCCCLARPVVIVIMPPTRGRPHRTELLLCGHHYRASRQALAAAGAGIFSLTGTPLTADIWPEAKTLRDPAPGVVSSTAAGGMRHEG